MHPTRARSSAIRIWRRSYELIAQGGRDAFYGGRIAEQIVAFSEANGGFFSMKDFADHDSTWVEPVSTTYRGYDVWELPPNGQGIAALEMLNVLEGFDLKSLGRLSPEYLHLFLRSEEVGVCRSGQVLRRSGFQPTLPIAELISKQYAEQQRRRIDPDQAADDVPAGDPQLAARRHGLPDASSTKIATAARSSKAITTDSAPR